MRLTATLATTLSLLLVLGCITAESRKHSVPKRLHTVQKRATVEDVLGNLTAEEPGILNEKPAEDLEKVYPGNCKEIYDAGQNTSGLYRISPVAGYEFTVFCDMNLRGGGWTVISRRVNNSISFNRNWTAYRNGFGEFNSNFWLGLQKIKDITEYNGATNELYIGMQGYHPSSTDRVAFSIYKSFTLKDESAMYALDISSYDSQESTAGDALKDHTDKAFATPDNDNANNCASRLCAGWWYIHCADSHLTGKWYASGYITNTSGEQDGIIWDTWTVQHESLNAVVMAIRPV